MTRQASTDGRLRVMQVIARMNVGGPAMQVVNIASALDPDRFDVRVYTGSVGPGEEDYLNLRAPSVPVTVVPGLGRSIRARGDAMAVRELYRAMRDLKPHVVHSHTAKAGVLARTAAVSARVRPRIHTFHGHLLHGYFSPAGTRAVVAAERALAQVTQRIVAVGDRVRDELVAARIGRFEQYVVHAPGVHLPAPPTRAGARRVLELPTDAPVVALVARLLPIKRPDRFLDVAGRVSRIRPDARFIVAGGGPLLDTLRRRAEREGLAVDFLGWRGDVETVYAAADVVMLTSDNEGMPVTLIEAALCARPCVTTNVGSASEVVAHEETGFVTDTDPEALAQAALRLIDDGNLRNAMGARAQARAARLFSAGTLIDQTQQLYETAVDAERARRR